MRVLERAADADEIVKTIVPAPQPFEAATETWDAAAARPQPNNTLRDHQASSLPGGTPRAHVRLTVNPEGRGDWKFADIKDIARGWFQGSRPNQGLLLATDCVLRRPLWDPSKGADELVDGFCRHYYGPAASQVAEYARRFEAAYEKQRLKVPWFAGNRLLQQFLSDAFLLGNQRLFDQAEQATETDALLVDRVRRARLSGDLETQFHLDRMEANYRERHGGLEGFPLDRQVIARRYRGARLSTFSRRVPDLDLQAQSAEVDKILKPAEGAPRTW